MTKTSIPREIAHLDFEVQSDVGDGLLQECCARVWGTTGDCIRPARWVATLRCCGMRIPCCRRHRRMGLRWDRWYCRKCHKFRNNEWIAWGKL